MRWRYFFLRAGNPGIRTLFQVLAQLFHSLFQLVDLPLLAGHYLIQFSNDVILIRDFGFQFDKAILHVRILARTTHEYSCALAGDYL